MRNTVILVVLAASGLGTGAAHFLGSHETREPEAKRPWLAAVSHELPGAYAPTRGDAGRLTRERNRQLALEIERALVAADPQPRETAFNVLLPELLQTEPEVLVSLIARQEPGDARDTLREEVARQWIGLDRDAAIEWIGSLDSAERRASATIAMRTLAAGDLAQAIYVADLFGVGRDDGSLQHMVQIRAIENPFEAARHPQ